MSAQVAGPDPEHVIRLGNEFTEVEVDRVRTGNGVRLRIRVPSSGAQILLCPLELEALAWQNHELFSRLLATPNGPEDEPPPPEEPVREPGLPSPLEEVAREPRLPSSSETAARGPGLPSYPDLGR